MLSARNLEVVYDDVVVALRGVGLDVPEGRIVALLGSNGAGKTTLLRAMTGLLRIHDAEITKGTVTLDGDPLTRRRPEEIVRRGVRQVLEGRRVFVEMTVEENLRVGAHTAAGSLRDNLDRVFTLFPVLAERREQTSGLLSGGEQQMLAIGRALTLNPKVLLLDEPTEGLAPIIVEELLKALGTITRAGGICSIIVEQNAQKILGLADRVVILERGAIVHDAASSTLKADPAILERFLGVSGATAH